MFLIQALLILSLAAGACAAEIVIVASSSIKPYQEASQGVKASLAVLPERRPGIAEFELGGQDEEALAAKIRDNHPLLIVALGSSALQFASDRFKPLPLVFGMVLSPRKPEPGRTGTFMDIPAEAKLQAIKKILKHARKIGMLYSSDSRSYYEDAVRAAPALNLEIVAQELSSGQELPEALRKLMSKVDCFLMVPDRKLYFPKASEYLLRESLINRMPVFGMSSQYTKAGALLALDCDYKDLGLQLGEIVARLSAGERPERIPPAGPRKVALSINKTTAERLGLDIPQALLDQATVFGE